MSILTTLTIETDDDFDVVLQSPNRGGGTARYGSSDTLSAELWQPGAASALATSLTVGWLTVASDGQTSQTGYDEGQTVTTLPTSLISTLMPGLRYTLKVFRTFGSPSRRERIATVYIKVRPLAVA